MTEYLCPLLHLVGDTGVALNFLTEVVGITNKTEFLWGVELRGVQCSGGIREYTHNNQIGGGMTLVQDAKAHQ